MSCGGRRGIGEMERLYTQRFKDTLDWQNLQLEEEEKKKMPAFCFLFTMCLTLWNQLVVNN